MDARSCLHTRARAPPVHKLFFFFFFCCTIEEIRSNQSQEWLMKPCTSVCYWLYGYCNYIHGERGNVVSCLTGSARTDERVCWRRNRKQGGVRERETGIDFQGGDFREDKKHNKSSARASIIRKCRGFFVPDFQIQNCNIAFCFRSLLSSFRRRIKLPE